jgi:hypothetical protein
VRGVDAAGEGRHHPAATGRRKAIVLADDPVAVRTRWTSKSNTCGSTAIGLAPRRELTSVGIKRMTGRKKLHLVIRTDDAPQ